MTFDTTRNATLTVKTRYPQQTTDVIYQQGCNVIFHRTFDAFEYMYKNFDGNFWFNFVTVKAVKMAENFCLLIC